MSNSLPPFEVREKQWGVEIRNNLYGLLISEGYNPLTKEGNNYKVSLHLFIDDLEKVKYNLNVSFNKEEELEATILFSEIEIDTSVDIINHEVNLKNDLDSEFYNELLKMFSLYIAKVVK